jgi:hypothetical protein
MYQATRHIEKFLTYHLTRYDIEQINSDLKMGWDIDNLNDEDLSKFLHSKDAIDYLDDIVVEDYNTTDEVICIVKLEE